MAMNSFGDWTSHEYSGFAKGLNTSAGVSSKLLQTNPVIQQSAQSATLSAAAVGTSNATLPDLVDWRTFGAVTNVKNQGSCGCCWAFSTAGSLEGQVYIKHGNLVSLSAQNLCDCVTACSGCNGGLMDPAFRYIQSNGGIETEAAYPFVGTQWFSWCQYNPYFGGVAANATVTGLVDLPAGNEIALQAAVAQIGPISVGIDASQPSFQFYASGTYNEPNCKNTLSGLDHAILVVGYGIDENNKPYWLCKNQWGTGWGLAGYIRMSRNLNNQCGIATLASYPLIA